MKKTRYRLKIVVTELEAASTTVEYQVALLSFVNCLINATQGLRERIRIRNEFIGKCEVLKIKITNEMRFRSVERVICLFALENVNIILYNYLVS